MRKFIAACFLIFLVSSVASTTIEHEEVRVDLASSEIEVEMEVGDLTSESLTYLTSYPVEEVEAQVDGSELKCDVISLQIGSEIQCETDRKDNFSVQMSFTASNLVEVRQQTNVFRYNQNFNRPTNSFRLRVLLPKGAGLLDSGNSSISVISPEDAETGSNGRRIFVEWQRKPDLGESVNFQVAYERFSTPINLQEGLIILAGLILLLLVGRSAYIRLNREDIENVYDDLESDEVEVLELLRESGGEMLQKDVVEELDYSKAKISGTVSELVEKDVLVKQKEGRSNKLSISKSYRS